MSNQKSPYQANGTINIGNLASTSNGTYTIYADGNVESVPKIKLEPRNGEDKLFEELSERKVNISRFDYKPLKNIADLQIYTDLFGFNIAEKIVGYNIVMEDTELQIVEVLKASMEMCSQYDTPQYYLKVRVDTAT